jgi:hypothetical protein
MFKLVGKHLMDNEYLPSIKVHIHLFITKEQKLPYSEQIYSFFIYAYQITTNLAAWNNTFYNLNVL